MDEKQIANASEWFKKRGFKFFVWADGEYGLIVTNDITIEITEGEVKHRANLYKLYEKDNDA